MISAFSSLILTLLIINSSSHGIVISIISPDHEPAGHFGTSLDSANGLMLVGAPDQSTQFPGSGKVYLYDVHSGLLLRTLVSPNPAFAGQFGYSIELSDKLAIVGAPGEIVDGVLGAGRVYVFSSETGALLHTIIDPNVQSGGFGESIDRSNGILAVGAGDKVGQFFAAGRVLLFNADTESLLRILVSPNPGSGGVFGSALMISDEIIVVGAEGEKVGGSFAGRAYVFNALTGSLINTLVSPNSRDSGFFGGSVDVAGGRVYVGACCETLGGTVYIFNSTTGSLLSTLSSPNADNGGNFGHFGDPLTLVKGDLIVGASAETVDGLASAGRIYVFDSISGLLLATMVSPHPQLYEGFGSSLDVANELVAVGAPRANVDGVSEVGVLYIFVGEKHSGTAPPLIWQRTTQVELENNSPGTL